MYALYVSQLSLELQQRLALPGHFCTSDPKLRITEGTLVPVDRLDTKVAIKWLFNPHSPLTSHHVQF